MNSSKALALVIWMFFLVLNVFATEQEPDVLLYKGEERMLFSNPLENYFDSRKKKRPKFMVEPLMISSGNWRGYVATWEIDSGRLYFRNVVSWICPGSTEASCKKVTLASLFPGKVLNGKVLADWFSGELRIADGKLLHYLHARYGSVYEREMIFDVTDGMVGDPKVVDNTKEPLPSELEVMNAELAKMKTQAQGERTTGPRPRTRSINIVPGQSVFKYGTPQKQLERVIGKGIPDSKYEDVYFVEYPEQGIQVSFDNKTNNVHVIFLYNAAPRYEGFAVPTVRTEKGIDWKSSEENVLAAYGKPLKDYSDESKSWRRLEYPGIDFRFEGGRLVRIGILGPDGN